MSIPDCTQIAMVGVHKFVYSWISLLLLPDLDILPSPTHGRHIIRFLSLRHTHLALRRYYELRKA